MLLISPESIRTITRKRLQLKDRRSGARLLMRKSDNGYKLHCSGHIHDVSRAMLGTCKLRKAYHFIVLSTLKQYPHILNFLLYKVAIRVKFNLALVKTKKMKKVIPEAHLREQRFYRDYNKQRQKVRIQFQIMKIKTIIISIVQSSFISRESTYTEVYKDLLLKNPKIHCCIYTQFLNF